jgi:hypothetical protein
VHRGSCHEEGERQKANNRENPGKRLTVHPDTRTEREYEGDAIVNHSHTYHSLQDHVRVAVGKVAHTLSFWLVEGI